MLFESVCSQAEAKFASERENDYSIYFRRQLDCLPGRRISPAWTEIKRTRAGITGAEIPKRTLLHR